MQCYNCNSRDLRSIGFNAVICNECGVIFEPSAYSDTKYPQMNIDWRRTMKQIFWMLVIILGLGLCVYALGVGLGVIA